MNASRSKVLWVACAALVAIASPGGAQPASPSAGLSARLGQIVSEAGLGDRIGISVVDVASGDRLFEHHGDLALNPASNMKLVTAAGVLLRLGPDFRMQTAVHGKIEEGGLVRELFVRGYGDPTLRTSDLVDLADGLADRGVQRVQTVVVDGSYFDDQYLPPAFDQQPDEIAAFRAPVAALTVERSAYELRVIPGAAEGEAATVRLGAEGYFDLTNEITTSAAGSAPNVIAIQRGDGEQMELTVGGTVPAGILGVGYRRRVERPLPFAAHAMVEALRRAGIHASGRVRLGETPSDAPMLVRHESRPVAEVITDLGKWSDNFIAETMLKVLGAEAARPGSSERGAQVLREVLARAGVPEGQATIVNGSGLFEGNRIAPAHLTHLLRHVYNDPGVRPEYLAHLAVGGDDGTLHSRLEALPRARIVRAKTGTLNDVITLSGYVLGPEPDRTIAFSVLANGIRGKQGQARAMADAVATAIAEDLWRAEAR